MKEKSVPEFKAPHGAEETRRRRGVCLSLEDTEEWKRRDERRDMESSERNRKLRELREIREMCEMREMCEIK